MLGLYDNPRTPDLTLVNYTDYDDLPATGNEYARLNNVVVWRDTATEGSIWVPAHLRDWTLITSIHTDTYTPGAPPADWTENLVGAGTISTVGGLIRLNSGATNTHLAQLYYTPPAGWAAATQHTIIVRGLAVDPPAQPRYGYIAAMFSAVANYDQFARFCPRDNASSQGGIARDTTAFVGATKAAQTTIKTYSLEAYGTTANDLCTALVVGDPQWRTGGVGTLYATGGSDALVILAYNSAGNSTVLDIESMAIYGKAA